MKEIMKKHDLSTDDGKNGFYDEMESSIKKELKKAGVSGADVDVDIDSDGTFDVEIHDKKRRVYADDIDDDGEIDGEDWEDAMNDRADETYGKLGKALKAMGADIKDAETYPENGFNHYNEEGEEEDGDSEAKGREYAEPHVWAKQVRLPE